MSVVVMERLKRLVMGPLAALAVVLAGHAHALAGNLIFIPQTANDDLVTPSALSADGTTVVGALTNDVNNPQPDQGFVWTLATGVPVALGTVSGFDQASFGTAVSNGGSVVVGTGLGSSGLQGFRWTPSGGIAGLGVASGDVGNAAVGISADGSTVVGGHDSSTAAGAFSWTQAGGFVNLGTLSGDTSAYGVAASANGSVIVGVSSNSGTGITQAFRWTAAGGMVGLGALSGDTMSMANAVSGDGSVVVGISYGNSANVTHAFRWSAATGMVNLGTVGADNSAIASATNSDGSVVVGESVGATDPPGAAFIWTSAGGMQPFYNFWLNSGNTIVNSNVQFYSLTGVSADGQVFLGTGTNPTGVDAGFVAYLQSSPLLASVLPESRSAQPSATVTAFATMINTATTTGTNCSVAPGIYLPATFVYQTTNPATNAVTGTANTPVNIAAGGAQSFVVAFTPTATIFSDNVPFNFSCTNEESFAPSVTGLNTLLLSAPSYTSPDIVALAATTLNDGIVHVVGAPLQGAFAVATDNVGANLPSFYTNTITVAANTGRVTLPITINLCQTNPTTGACLQPPSATVTTTISGNATPTFGVFVSASSTVPFDPANNRVFVTFTDSISVIRGQTSVAVETQ